MTYMINIIETNSLSADRWPLIGCRVVAKGQ